MSKAQKRARVILAEQAASIGKDLGLTLEQTADTLRLVALDLTEAAARKKE